MSELVEVVVLDGEGRGSGRRRILRFIRVHLLIYGYPPTIREICDGTGLWKAGVEENITKMRLSGLLERSDGKSRHLVPSLPDMRLVAMTREEARQ